MSVKRFLGAAPAALLTTACASRPWTPSVPLAYWAEPVPPAGVVTLPTMSEAQVRWQLPPDNVWARWQKMTLLAVLDVSGSRSAQLPEVSQLDVVTGAESAATRVASAGLPADTAWMVDLRGAASVAFGARLSRAANAPVAPVLTFNNWPADNEIVPAEETLSALVRLQPRLPQQGELATRPVILLDAWRLAFREDEPDDDVTDNRYMLTPGDLPDPAIFLSYGITRIVYVVEDLDDTETEEDDLHEAFMAYQAAGIAIFMVDLDFVARKLDPQAGWGSLADYRYTVAPRTTICADVRFYARARGGFGGVHGVPSGGRGGFGFGG